MMHEPTPPKPPGNSVWWAVAEFDFGTHSLAKSRVGSSEEPLFNRFALNHQFAEAASIMFSTCQFARMAAGWRGTSVKKKRRKKSI